MSGAESMSETTFNRSEATFIVSETNSAQVGLMIRVRERERWHLSN
jgi:hypothetical protein